MFGLARRRRRIELIGLELISALTKSGLIRNKSIVEVYLMTFDDTPWSYSGLSEAAQIERSVIRHHITLGTEIGEYDWAADRFYLSQKGWVHCLRRLRDWQRCIDPEIRKFLFQFFKANSSGAPLRDMFKFVLSLDRLARIVRLEFSYIAALKVVEWEQATHGATIKDTAERTGFSYSVIHKQFSKMTDKGILRRVDGRYFVTRRGKRHSLGIFINSWKLVTFAEWKVALRMMLWD